MTSTTYPVVFIGSNAISIKEDIAIITGSSLAGYPLETISNLNDLITGEVITRPYATFEPDFWLLNGEYKLAPTSNAKTALLSSTLGDNITGDFASSIALIITFNSVHSNSGITLYFSEYSNDYADDISVYYFDASDTTIQHDSYLPTGTTFSTHKACNNFKKIQINFYSVNKLQHRLRVLGINLDDVAVFSGENVLDANLIENINPLSIELPVNTLDLKVFSSDGAFSIVNPTGTYANLQYKEPIELYEVLHNQKVYLGRFYLDEWDSETENIATFKASDAIGLMTNDYLPALFYGTAPAQPLVDPLNEVSTVYSDDLIDDIMNQAGVTYDMDSSLNGIVVKGWLPIVPCREALQQVLFRIGAYATCARNGRIQIKPLALASSLASFDNTFTSADKSMDETVKLRKLVTGVEITSHDYASDGLALSQLISFTTVTPSTFVLKFDKPVRDVAAVSGASVRRYGSTWYELVDAVAGACSFTGRGYTDTKKVEGVYSSLPTGTLPNVIKIEQATLVDVANVTTATQRVYDYYQQRYVLQTRLYGSLAVVGQSALVDAQGSQIKGFIERMETNLAGGFISKIDVVGVVT